MTTKKENKTQNEPKAKANNLYKATRNLKMDYLNIAIAQGQEIELDDKLLAQLKEQIAMRVLVPVDEYDSVMAIRKKRSIERDNLKKEKEAERQEAIEKAKAESKKETVGIIG